MTDTGTKYWTKTIDFGKVDAEGKGRVNQVTVEVELDDGKLSMTGTVWNRNHTDIVSAGQNHDDLLRLLPENPKLTRMVEVWRRWYLNNMREGCEHQRAEGWDKRPIDPDKPLDTYGKHCPGQRQDSWNMLGWVRPDEHPHGLLMKPCPVCGYRYWSAWLREELPDDIVVEVKSW